MQQVRGQTDLEMLLIAKLELGRCVVVTLLLLNPYFLFLMS